MYEQGLDESIKTSEENSSGRAVLGSKDDQLFGVENAYIVPDYF